jgi:hypothetical protein
MAPVLAITSVVARTSWLKFFDPVGEFFKPFVTGPSTNPHFPSRRTEMRTGKKLWRNRKARKELTRRLQSENPGLEVVHPHAAGIDKDFSDYHGKPETVVAVPT